MPNSAWHANISAKYLLLAKSNELGELGIVSMPRGAEPNLRFVLGRKPRSTDNPASELTDDFKSAAKARA
jgi:hypothetical protein